jgi:hypothetical protein
VNAGTHKLKAGLIADAVAYQYRDFNHLYKFFKNQPVAALGDVAG